MRRMGSLPSFALVIDMGCKEMGARVLLTSKRQGRTANQAGLQIHSPVFYFKMLPPEESQRYQWIIIGYFLQLVLV